MYKLFFLIFLVGCTSNSVLLPEVPHRALVMHADTDFTPAERAIIHRGTESLMSQVGLQVDIIYDLDFAKVADLPRFENLPQLMKIPRDAPLTRDISLKYRGIVFAWTVAAVPTRVYIAADVLNGGEVLYLHVVIHELLHVMGCEHVSDPTAVLYWQTDHSHMAVRLVESDRLELLRALTPSGGATGQRH